MTEPQPETAVAVSPRRSWGAGALAIGLVLGFVVGARWHGALPQWLTGEADPSAEPQVAVAQLWTCGMHPQVIQDHPGQCPICHMALTPLEPGAAAGTIENQGPDASAITIDPTVVQNMGVKTAAVARGPIVRHIRAVGTIVEAEPNVHEVNLLVSGRVRRLYADTTGMRVAKHAPLFDLYSPELQAPIEEAIRLRRSAPAGDVDASAGRSLYAASLRRLELFGFTSAQAQRLSKLDRAPRTVTFTSPADGVVTDKAIVEGAAIMAGTAALRIVDLRELWIEANVFEQDLAAIERGQPITASVPAFPGESFAGEVDFVAPYLDPESRTARVRLRVDNASERLRPGMYATVELDAELAPDALLVAREAVIDTGKRKLAFVALGHGRFAPREIELGVADGEGHVQVLAGLKLGEEVVTSGQFLLDSESRIREAVQKFVRERESTVVTPMETAKPVDQAPATGSRAPVIAPTKPQREPRAKQDVKPLPEPPKPPPPVGYTCPMHLEVRSEGPGSCPICGMDLEPEKSAP